MEAQDVWMDPMQMAPKQSSHLYSFLVRLVMSVSNVHGTQLLKKSKMQRKTDENTLFKIRLIDSYLLIQHLSMYIPGLT